MTRITAVRSSNGHITVGACRNLIFRLRVYCSKEIAKLTAASPIQTCGLPGKKNSSRELFQEAISQGWCQRNNNGMASTKKRISTATMLVLSIGVASR